MLAHGGDQDRIGQGQESVFECAAHCRWILHQVGDRVDEFIVGPGVSGDRCRGPADLPDHNFTPFSKIDKHVVGVQGLQVMGKIIYLHSSGRHETMAAGEAAGGDLPDAKGNHCSAIEGEQPVDGAGKADPAVAPAHGLGKRQLQGQLGQQFAQQFYGGLTLDLLDHGHIFALGSGNHLQLLHHNPLGCGKTESSPGREVVRAERRLSGGAQELFLPIRLAVDQAADAHRQPPRGGNRPYLRKGELKPGQTVGQLFPQTLQCRPDKTGRNLLGPYLKKKLVLHFFNLGVLALNKRGPINSMGPNIKKLLFGPILLHQR